MPENSQGATTRFRRNGTWEVRGTLSGQQMIQEPSHRMCGSLEPSNPASQRLGNGRTLHRSRHLILVVAAAGFPSLCWHCELT